MENETSELMSLYVSPGVVSNLWRNCNQIPVLIHVPNMILSKRGGRDVDQIELPS